MKFKKIISAAVGAVMLCASLPFSSTTVDFIKDNVIIANAEDEIPATGKCGENVYYSLSDDGVLTISGSGDMTDYDSLAGANNSPFQGNNLVKSVIINNGITSIGCNVFCDCTNLVNLTIPNSVKFINDGAFCYCEKLTKVVIPDSVVSIGNGSAYGGCFMGCKSLKEITISNSLNSIAPDSFSNCTNLESIEIPDSVTSIDSRAFYDCENLENIIIPDSVASIGGWVFKNTKWLENKQKENPFVIVNDILIDGTACSGDITIPDSVTSIGNSSFYYSSSITSVVIPNSVTSICDYAFSGCDNLTSVTIPNSVTKICDGAFYYNYSTPTYFYYSGTQEEWEKLDVESRKIVAFASHKFDDRYEHSNDSGTVIEVGNITVDVSENTANVPVKIFNNPGFAGSGFKYTLDNNIEVVGLESGLIESPVKSFAGNVMAIRNAQSEDITGDGVLYSIKVKLPENIKDGDVFNISAEMIGICNADCKDINAKVYGGSISVVDKAKNAVIIKQPQNPEEDINNGKTVIEVGSIKVKPSVKTVTVPVAIFNNPGFAGTGIKYTFDSRMIFSNMKGNLIESPVKSMAGNVVAITSITSHDLTANGVLYYLNFELPENAKAGDIFDISAEIDTFANANGEKVETKIYGGSISVIDDTSSNTEPSTTITTEESSETESIDNSLIYGDINSDEKVTIADAVLLNKYLVGSAALTNVQIKSADCLLDKDVNSSDTLAILKLIVGTYDSLPVYP